VTGTGSRYVIEGNWLSIERFREYFKQSMTEGLCQHAKNKSLSEVLSHDNTIFLSQPVHTDELTSGPLEPASTMVEDSDSGISAKASNLNPDVLALMEKTGAYQHSAVSYDLQTMTINIDCDDATGKEKIKEELFTAYRELMMGGKLKEHSVSVSDVQQASAIVEEYNKTFNHTYFKYDVEKGEIKCLSTDARQMQHVRKRLNASIQHLTPAYNSASANSSTSYQSFVSTKSVFIDLPKFSRRVTIKLGDIVDEDVDAIVNAANERLMHGAGVAAAIDKASNGEVQKASTRLISQHGSVATGDAVATDAGGNLKCKLVIHTVGPMAYQHKQNCGPLLKNACNNTMVIAERFEYKSVSFPPISSGLYGVSKELVANVMLSALCSYKCSSPAVLTDVRIVIIDNPTYQVFLNVFHRERQRLELLPDDRPLIPSVTSTSSPLKPNTFHYNGQPHFPLGAAAHSFPPPGFPQGWAGNAQYGVPLFSQVVAQQPNLSMESSPGNAAGQDADLLGSISATSTLLHTPLLQTPHSYSQATMPQPLMVTKAPPIMTTNTKATVTSYLPVTSSHTPPNGSTGDDRGEANEIGARENSNVSIDSFKSADENIDPATESDNLKDDMENKDHKKLNSHNKDRENNDNEDSHTTSTITLPLSTVIATTPQVSMYPNLEELNAQQTSTDGDPRPANISSHDGTQKQTSYSTSLTLSNKSLPPSAKEEKKEESRLLVYIQIM